MKESYDQHRKLPNTAPLHIVKDQIAECYPDLFPPQPEVLERARLVQTVAIPLGFVSQRGFPALNGNGQPDRQFAFLRHIEELGEEQPVPLGRTVEALGMRMASNPELLAEIEHTINAVMMKAADADKVKYAGQLRQHLAQKKNALKAAAPGIDAENAPAYQAERDRVVAFMRRYGLANGGAELAQEDTQQVTTGTAALGN